MTMRRLVASSMLEERAPPNSSTEIVRTITLPELLAAGARRVDGGLTFVKIDTEGMELRVIGILDPARCSDVVLLYEDHGRNQADEVTKQTLQQGFEVHFLHDDGSVPAVEPENIDVLRTFKTDRTRGYNLVAVSPRGIAADRIRRALAGNDRDGGEPGGGRADVGRADATSLR